jgi:predicted ATPase
VCRDAPAAGYGRGQPPASDTESASMGQSIDKITLQGFKSIRSLEDFELGPVNVLIGANGSGKSNFVSFFSLLREMVEGRLQKAVNKAGGADVHLFLGPKITKEITAKVQFGDNCYEVSLEPAADNRLIFSFESVSFASTYPMPPPQISVGQVVSMGTGHSESQLRGRAAAGDEAALATRDILEAISNWVVYHFHDTSETAAMRRIGSVRDSERLRPEGENLAAFLFHLREEETDTYNLIVDAVRLAAPFLRGFKLRPRKSNGDEIIDLEWQQKDSDYPFHVSQLSDGTLRFIALATALLQPNPPATVLIDEPELGLHPQALDVLANLILQAKTRTQLIVSTQSASLLNAFEPEQIVVIDREQGESRFRRLKADDLREWLAQDYTLGDLWQKNVYGGGVSHE